MRIDHLVWYGADLAAQSRWFAERMNAAPLYGGEHPGEGTANCVLGVGASTYLEILGRDPLQSEDRLEAEIRQLSGAGLYHWAVGGIELNELAERARRAGLESGEHVPGGRARPDGSWLGWTCLGLRNHGFGALMPFFIDWMESEHPAKAAPFGGRLVDLEVHTPRADELRETFHVLGLDIRVSMQDVPGFSATIESLHGSVVLRSFEPVPRGYVI